VQANKAIAAQKPAGASLLDASTVEALFVRLEHAHFEMLQQRGDEWEVDVQVGVEGNEGKREWLNSNTHVEMLQ